MAKKSLRAALERHEHLKNHEERLKAKKMNIEAAAEARKKKLAPPKHWWNPHNSSTLTVFLGEADFAFAKACLEENYIDQAIVTNFDSQEEIFTKYPAAEANMEFLNTDARVDATYFGVDATALDKHKQLWSEINRFKRENPSQPIDFIFNFPHLGASIKDQDRNIRAHQSLLLDFFKQIGPLDARVIVTLFDGEPYDSWQIKALARQQGLKLERSGAFHSDKYPGYAHCLTAKQGRTSKNQHERNSRVYAFVKKVEEPEESEPTKETKGSSKGATKGPKGPPSKGPSKGSKFKGSKPRPPRHT